MEQIVEILANINKNLEIVSKTVQALRSGEGVRNLALSNFATTQAELNECHAEKIQELTEVASSLRAIGKLNIPKV